MKLTEQTMDRDDWDAVFYGTILLNDYDEDDVMFTYEVSSLLYYTGMAPGEAAEVLTTKLYDPINHSTVACRPRTEDPTWSLAWDKEIASTADMYFSFVTTIPEEIKMISSNMAVRDIVLDAIFLLGIEVPQAVTLITGGMFSIVYGRPRA